MGEELRHSYNDFAAKCYLDNIQVSLLGKQDAHDTY